MLILKFTLSIILIVCILFMMIKLLQIFLRFMVALIVLPFYLVHGELLDWWKLWIKRHNISSNYFFLQRSVADEVEEGNMRAYYRQKTDPLNKDNYFRK